MGVFLLAGHDERILRDHIARQKWIAPHLYLLHHQVLDVLIFDNMPYYCCQWSLDGQQSVKISNMGHVAFRHVALNRNVYRGVSLSPIQFAKFCDCLRIIDLNTPTRFMCELGKNATLEKVHNSIKLSVVSQKDSKIDCRFFRFHMDSWSQYIRHVHPKVLSFLRHGRSRTDDTGAKHNDKAWRHVRGQRHVLSANGRPSRPPPSAQEDRRKSTVSREAYDADIEDGELWDDDCVSEGKNSISGQDLPEDCAVFVS